jgi:6-phosphofructokinase 1
MFAQDPGEIALFRTTPATDVTGNFLRYARPLIGEDWPDVPLEGCLQRFVRLQPIRAETRLAAYVPEAHRE